MHEIEGRGITKIVDSNQVEDLTRKGWKVIGMYQETMSDINYINVPDPTQGYAGATTSIQTYTPSTSAYFILELDEESSIGQLGKELEEAKAMCTDFRRSCEERDKTIKEFEKKLKGLECVFESHKKAYDSAQEEYKKTNDLKRKMETDIGKIEKALGTQRMKEILAEEK